MKEYVKKEHLQPLIDKIKNDLVTKINMIDLPYQELFDDPTEIEFIISEQVLFTPLSNDYSRSYIEPGWDRCRELLNIIRTTEK